MSEKIDEMKWRYDKGHELFQEDMMFLFEQAEKVEKLQSEIERIHTDLETYQDKCYSEDVQKASTWVLEDSQKRLDIND